MTYKKTIWLVGRSSRLGAALENILMPALDNVLIGTDVDEVDITDLDAVEDFAEKVNPDIIVNCAEKRDRQWCEEKPEEAFALYAIGARNLAIVANKHQAHLFYLSSDFVFDGTSTEPYREFDQVNPTTVYGRSKLAGERFVRSLCPYHTILRSSWMYGKRYLNDIINKARTGKIAIHKDIIGTPTSSLELAETIIRFFNTNQFGTFHISCEGEASLREFIQEILSLTDIEAEITVDGEPSRFELLRPKYSVLDNFMLRAIKAQAMRDWKEALKIFIRERKVGR